MWGKTDGVEKGIEGCAVAADEVEIQIGYARHLDAMFSQWRNGGVFGAAKHERKLLECRANGEE